MSEEHAPFRIGFGMGHFQAKAVRIRLGRARSIVAAITRTIPDRRRSGRTEPWLLRLRLHGFDVHISVRSSEPFKVADV